MVTTIQIVIFHIYTTLGDNKSSKNVIMYGLYCILRRSEYVFVDVHSTIIYVFLFVLPCSFSVQSYAILLLKLFEMFQKNSKVKNYSKCIRISSLKDCRSLEQGGV